LTIQDLGSIGELVAAIATLVYLAVQVSTFQDIAGAMSSTTEAVATHPEIAVLMVKATGGLVDLTVSRQQKSDQWVT